MAVWQPPPRRSSPRPARLRPVVLGTMPPPLEWCIARVGRRDSSSAGMSPPSAERHRGPRRPRHRKAEARRPARAHEAHCTCLRVSCASALRSRRTPVHGRFARRAPRAAGSRSSSTSRHVASPVSPDGVHWYDPMEHGSYRGATAPATPRRSSQRRPVADELEVRRARPPPRLLGRRLDARADACARRRRQGSRPRLWTRFPDANVSSLVGADGVQEFPLALVDPRRGRACDPARGRRSARIGR